METIQDLIQDKTKADKSQSEIVAELERTRDRAQAHAV